VLDIARPPSAAAADDLRLLARDLAHSARPVCDEAHKRIGCRSDGANGRASLGDRRGQEPMRGRDWRAYHAATDGRPPRPTLMRALAAFAREGRGPGLLAVDLGCGIGRDALPLLRAGWRVRALDADAAALAELEARAAAAGLSGLATAHGRFEETELPACDLVNASFALFACPPAAFGRLWARIVGVLRPNGRFAGQLLGPRDSWAARPGTTTLDRESLDGLLAALAVEHLEEEECDGVTPFGEAKRWHIWHVNARRPG
jgi:tellurite methyltransferase